MATLWVGIFKGTIAPSRDKVRTIENIKMHEPLRILIT